MSLFGKLFGRKKQPEPVRTFPVPQYKARRLAPPVIAHTSSVHAKVREAIRRDQKETRHQEDDSSSLLNTIIAVEVAEAIFPTPDTSSSSSDFSGGGGDFGGGGDSGSWQ